MAPLVSVVIPTYNRARSVVAAVDSVLRQTHANVEALVVDDGSSDDTQAVLVRAYADDSRVNVLRQENRGVCAARNLGLRAARGDFIALLDSDDAWLPWKLELQLACLAANPEAGMVWTDMAAVDGEGAVKDPRYLRKMYAGYGAVSLDSLFQAHVPLARVVPRLAAVVGDAELHCGSIFSQMVLGNLVHTSTVLLRRERLERVGGFNEALRVSGEDFDFHLRTCREGPVSFADVPSTLYRIGDSDALSRKENHVHMAANLVRTLEPILRDSGSRVDLPEAKIRAKLAQAHLWLGMEQLDAGDASLARSSFSRSFRHRPSVRTAGLLMATLLPGPLRLGLRRLHRAIAGAP